MITQVKQRSLKNEAMMIQSWLHLFDSPYRNGRRKLHFQPTGDYLIVENFPLSDHFNPDYLDLLIVTEHYPDQPPIGLYMLNNEASEASISKIMHHLNWFTTPSVMGGGAWANFIYNNDSWYFK